MSAGCSVVDMDWGGALEMVAAILNVFCPLMKNIIVRNLNSTMIAQRRRVTEF